jgi:choice-of-anchor C domain-containing protein
VPHIKSLADRGRLAAAAMLVATLVGSQARAGTNLLVNGSFEDPNHNWTPSGLSWDHVPAGSSAITGWTIGAAGVDWHDDAEFGPLEDGTYAVDLNGSGNGLADTGTISQSFSTVAGETYLLSFYLSGPQPGGFPDPRQVNVDVNGVDTIFSQAASPPKSLVWGHETMAFTASGASSTLTFSSVNGSGYWGPILDNVSVSSAVPEPASWGMMLFGVGMAGAGLRMVRRRSGPAPFAT